MVTVLGVDACKAGWVGIRLDGGVHLRAFVGSTMASLVRQAGSPEVVAIDIPIGLPRAGRRRADELAREAVGPRRNSVFFTPVRPALEAATHKEGTLASIEATGAGMSQQAFALRTKILEVDTWLTTTTVRVIEIHPEVTFATMAGHHLTHPKKTWAGMAQRRALLSAHGIDLPDDLGRAGEVAVDDVLDAAAAAWTADRFARGDAITLPSPPEVVLGSSRPMAIVA